MKTSSTAAVLLSAAILVGCGDRTPQDTQNLQQPEPLATADVSAPAVTETIPAAQEPSPAQDSAVRRASATPRPAAPRAESRPVPSASATAQPAPAAPAPRATASPAAPRYREVAVPANTALTLELLTAVSSETAQVETPVQARLRQPLVVDGYTVAPAGAVLSGNVIDVARAGRVQGRSRLVFRFTELRHESTTADFRTNPLTFEGEATKGQDAAKIGAGAVGGAIIGGILGGGSGAAKGAAIGGAAGTGVVLATRGQEVSLEAGTAIDATLATPYYTQVPLQ